MPDTLKGGDGVGEGAEGEQKPANYLLPSLPLPLPPSLFSLWTQLFLASSKPESLSALLFL